MRTPLPSPRELRLWVAGRLNLVVSPALHQRIAERLDAEVSKEQAIGLARRIEAMTDETFATWFVDQAEPWEQSMILAGTQRLLDELARARPGDSMVQGVAAIARRGEGLRQIAVRTLDAMAA